MPKVTIPDTEAALDGSLPRLFAAPRRPFINSTNADAALDGSSLGRVFSDDDNADDEITAIPEPESAPKPAPKRRGLFSGFRRAAVEVVGTLVGVVAAGAAAVVGDGAPEPAKPEAASKADCDVNMQPFTFPIVEEEELVTDAEGCRLIPVPAFPTAAGELSLYYVYANDDEEDEPAEACCEDVGEETKFAEDSCTEAFDVDTPPAPLTLTQRLAKAYGRLCWGLRTTRAAFLQAAAALRMAAHVVLAFCFDYGGLITCPDDVEWTWDGEVHS